MNTLLAILIIAAIIYYFGWYSLPEDVFPGDFQEPPPKNELLRGAEPFFFQGKSDTAFLLVHGYESSPFTLRSLGEQLHASGHTVIAPLLPGHGTSLKRLAETRYEHWYEAVRRVYAKERHKYKKFFLVGFSLGGNICMRVAVQYRMDIPPSALILLSAPVALNGFLNGAIVVRDWRMIFTGIAKFFLGPVSKRRDLVSSDIINPTVSYNEAYVVPPLHSLRTNVGKVKKYLKYITVPVCLIHASNDKTIDVENMHYIMRKIKSTEKHAYVFRIDEDISTRHELLTHELIRDKVVHYMFTFLEDFEHGFKYNSQIIAKYTGKDKRK